jgi:alcohol dehydrogenase YqhD (iron-dependent ADH family)
MQKTLPKYVTACGMADIISHVMEPYFDEEKNTPIQDALGEGIIKTVIAAEGVLSDLENIVHRTNLSWAATLAINGWADVGRAGKAWDAHTIEHDVGALTDCAHGAGLAVVHPAWLHYLNKKDPEKFVKFAKNVFGLEQNDMSDEEFGAAGIEKLKEYFKKWDMPVTLQELGVPSKDIEMLAKKMTQNPEGQELCYNDVLNVLKSC